MYNPKSKRTSKQIGAVKKKTLDGLTANKNIDDIIALSKISNTQTKDIGNLNSGLSKVSASVSSKQNKLTLTTTGSSGPATLNNDTLNVPDYSLSLSGFVPYTGATGNVDLGEYEIKVGQVEFDQTPTGTAGVAIMRWNDQDGTIDLGLKGGNVTLQIGQEQVTRVVNKTGSDLLEANYQAVRISGAQGNRLKVDLAQANNDANSADTIGIVTETINNNQEGFVTTSGLVRGINTTGSIQGETWSDGDILYLSGTVAGQLTNIKPAAPIHTVIMGYVVRAHVTQGQIYVKVDNGYELDELHNVAITTPLNDQVLQYESATSLWKNKTISTGITIGTTTINSGTVGRVLFEGAGNVVSQSTNLFWDATNNRLGIGTSSPFGSFDVRDGDIFATISSNANLRSRLTYQGLYVSRSTDGGYPENIISTSSAWLYNSRNSHSFFRDGVNLFNVGGGFTSGAMNINTNGNVLIGTTTDAGFKLDVNGTARVQGNVTIAAASPILNINVSNNAQTSAIYMNATDGNPRGALITNITSGEVRLFAGTGSYFLTMYSNNAERMRIFVGGNVGINTTTDAGFRLDVNGSMRATTMRSDNPVIGFAPGTAGVLIGSNQAYRIICDGSNYYDFRTNTGIVYRLRDDGSTSFGSNTIAASAMVDIQSTTKGFLPPRMTNAQMLAIATPAEGLVVYDTTNRKLCCYDGATWQNLF